MKDIRLRTLGLTTWKRAEVIVPVLSFSTLLFTFLCFSSLTTVHNIDPQVSEEEHPIVVPLPTRTLADRLLDAKTIVLAKEATDKPFSYAAHTALRGSLLDADSIGLFMNSSIRRILNKFPERSVVLIGNPDGEQQKWEVVGTPRPEIDTLVEHILMNEETWESDSIARFNFFVERFGHSNNTIHDLAYLEVGRAPYSEIRQLSGVVHSNEIHAFLRRIEVYEWHALYILLLGLSDDAYDQKVVKDAFFDSARFGTVNRLSAWTTAYLEMNPEEALAAIIEHYFSVPGRDIKELDAIMAAVSAHGSEGQVQLRDGIVEGYKVLLKNHPNFIAPVVKDLVDWERWDFVEIFRDIMKDPPPTFSYTSSIMIRRYINAAQAARGH